MSTFTYFPTLPNPPDDPADDVAGMQTNSASINSIIGVDHVGFNTIGGGQHAQVTFNANNVPSTPVSPPVLFTNNVNGIPELFYYSGSAAQSANQYAVTSGTNGSVMIMGGIILKWGSFAYSGSTVGTVTFASAFPNHVFNAQVSAQSTSATVGVITSLFIGTGSISTTGFQAHIQTSGSGTVYWFAIGN